MTPCLLCSSSNSLVSDLWRAFWPGTVHFKGTQPRRVRCFGTTEIQGHRQVWRARRRGPRTLSTTTDANLDCAFIEIALVFVTPKIGKAWAPPVHPPFPHVFFYTHRTDPFPKRPWRSLPLWLKMPWTWTSRSATSTLSASCTTTSGSSQMFPWRLVTILKAVTHKSCLKILNTPLQSVMNWIPNSISKSLGRTMKTGSTKKYSNRDVAPDVTFILRGIDWIIMESPILLQFQNLCWLSFLYRFENCEMWCFWGCLSDFFYLCIFKYAWRFS